MKKKKFSPIQWIGAIALFILFILLTLFIYGFFHEESRFEKFLNNFFISELSSNPITLHYTLADSSEYGIDESALTLPVYNTEQFSDTLSNLDKTLSELKKFNAKRLSPDNQYAYILLCSYLTAARECSSYQYFDEPLSPSSGVLSELPILLAEYRISSLKDVENYLSILSQVPGYFEGLMLYEREKSANGMFMSDSAADKLIEQCATLMDTQAMKNGEHFLELTFNERLSKLVEQNLIDNNEALHFESENKRLLTTVVAPAYDKMADELTLLKGSGNDSCGLANYKGGREYYTAYLRLTTGSYRDIDKIKKMLATDFEHNLTKLIALAGRHPAIGNYISSGPITFPAMSQEDMLTKLRGMMREDYPDIPFSDNGDASCEIKYVNDSLEPYTAPAFYMTPPIDNSRDNTIYINRQTTHGGLSLFTTLAHEGYPGHLYQTVYSRQHMQGKNTAKLQNILYYGGYIEGWAMYAELNSYDYAIALSKDTQPETEYIYEADKLNRQIQLCLYSLLDIMIHYDGADYDKVSALLNAIGFTDEAGIRAVYEYIVEEPCNYLKYYLGYLEILELKEKAMEMWGRDYTPKSFHTFILNNGPADYRTLERLLNLSSKEKTG